MMLLDSLVGVFPGSKSGNIGVGWEIVESNDPVDFVDETFWWWLVSALFLRSMFERTFQTY